MKATVRDRYGSPDVVGLRDVDTPVPVDDQVLVRVRAASVNRADLDGLRPRPGFARLFMGLRAPRDHRVGIDVAGVVESVGPTVTRFQPGTWSSATWSSTRCAGSTKAAPGAKWSSRSD